ncbi:MAG: TolC family protein [Rubrivivax sp.]
MSPSTLPNLKRSAPRARWVAVSAVIALAGCAAPKPAPLTTAGMDVVTLVDAQRMRQGVEPIQSPLGLEEAMARALKYNLDRRGRMMEEAIALRQFDAAAFDMMPRVMAEAGYNWRDRDRITLSRNTETGELSPSRFVSQDRSHTLSGLEFTWSLLDLTLGYYGARQQADRALIATERRRKAMHQLLQDVRTAYFRALAAQKLRDEVNQTVRLAEEALRDARGAEALRVRSPLDALRYQRQVLENLRLLEAIGHELSSAQVELAQLINAPLGQTLVLAEQDRPDVAQMLLQMPITRMEDAVLANNPDLREAHYSSRLARDEVRRTMARLFPNVSLNLGAEYDSDSYQVNRHWQDAGLQLSFNLLNLLSGPAQMQLAEAGVALADQRRIAMQLAVLAQMHLARLALQNARDQFARADAIWDVDRKITVMVRHREAAQTQSKLDTISNATSATLSRLRRYQALGQMQAAENRLTATLGFDPRLGRTDGMSVQQITEQIRQQFDAMAQLVQTLPEKK